MALAACKKEEARAGTAQEPQSTGQNRELMSEGENAPDVEFRVHTGETVRLADLRGKPVVVYFYPKDDTPGCTLEAQELRDLWTDIQKTNAVVIGVSSDDEASHQSFAQKYELPFWLAVDNDHKLANAFHVPLTLGKAKRVTFVIDGAGRIRKVFPAVNPKGHGAEVLLALKNVASG